MLTSVSICHPLRAAEYPVPHGVLQTIYHIIEFVEYGTCIQPPTRSLISTHGRVTLGALVIPKTCVCTVFHLAPGTMSPSRRPVGIQRSRNEKSPSATDQSEGHDWFPDTQTVCHAMDIEARSPQMPRTRPNEDQTLGPRGFLVTDYCRKVSRLMHDPVWNTVFQASRQQTSYQSVNR